MAEDLPDDPKYKSTMEQIEALKHTLKNGTDYWRAREIQKVLGYADWTNFRDTVGRAASAMEANGTNPSHHVGATTVMMARGNGSRYESDDMFLTRGACYMVAINGDATKPEIAAAQAYFVTRTREWEIKQQAIQDEKRLEIREKTKTSFKAVSSVAKSAGVKNSSQSRFHDARNLGLYGMSGKDVKSRKGVGHKENAFDRMGTLELSAHDFQMNLAAETIEKESVRGESNAIRKNREVAAKVRQTMLDSGSRPPEDLPAAEPIKEVAKRLKRSSVTQKIT
ncbi:BRO family protein [Loktanella sp. Alg231-35]|uniref:BRO family protein n=1 Tax=Loktanella sp. Alg231-35 TaxID=1922220 RepID=UPI000D54DF8F|nr:BRO family protein [Loktanella sp. Alg231-35]